MIWLSRTLKRIWICDLQLSDNINKSLISGSYILLAMVVVTASFGVTATLFASVFLTVSSVIWLFRHPKSFRLLGIEKLYLCLLCWLILRAMIEADWSGVMYVINEYRLLWMAPLIAIPLSHLLVSEDVLTPLFVGSLFYLCGSILMVFFSDPFDVISYKQDVQGFVGPYLSLGGKFVHGLWAVGAISIGLGVAYGSRATSVKRACYTFVVAALVFTVLVEESRTSYLMISFVFVAFLAKLGLSKKQAFWIGLSVFSLFAISLSIDSGFRSQVILSVVSVRDIFESGQLESSSIGQRLAALVTLSDLEYIEILVGLAPSDGQLRIESWVESGLLVGEPARARNLHSDIAHLILAGGLISVSIYIVLAYKILRLIVCVSPRHNEQMLVLGLGIAAFTTMFISGAINSTLLDIRERHLVLLIFIALSVALRKSGASHAIND